MLPQTEALERIADRSIPSSPATLGEWLDWLHDLFCCADLYFGHGTDNAWDEALALLFGWLQMPADRWQEALAVSLKASDVQQLLALADKRVFERIPVPYLIGTAWFAHRPYRVDSRVLIPRSPISELIQQRFSPWLHAQNPAHILDLCAGSGCLGIACAHQFQEAQVVLGDFSQETLSLAEDNIRQHGLTDRVRVVYSDLFDQIPRLEYDLIVSNPPYVSEAELAAMPPEYHHEPRQALMADADGLTFARRILQVAGNFLSAKGLLVLELGQNAGAFMQENPHLPFNEVALVHGGEGVLVLQADELHKPFTEKQEN